MGAVDVLNVLCGGKRTTQASRPGGAAVGRGSCTKPNREWVPAGEKARAARATDQAEEESPGCLVSDSPTAVTRVACGQCSATLVPVQVILTLLPLPGLPGTEADGCGARNWVLLNQECCTPKTTIRIRVSVLFSFVGVKSKFFLKFYRILHFMNFKVVVM